MTFESAFRRLPGGVGYSPGNTPKQPEHWHGLGWLVEILPHIEQQPLADVFERFKEFDFVGNAVQKPEGMLENVQKQPDGLACPSDTSGEQLLDQQPQWNGILVAPTSYRGVMGSNQMARATASFPTISPFQDYCNDGRMRCNGLIWRNSSLYPVRIRQVTHGLSKTMMVGEDMPSHNYHTMWSFANGDSSSTFAPLNYSLRDPLPEEWWDVRGFRSLHPSGANFAFGDGHVEFVQEDIEFELYKEMSTISDKVHLPPSDRPSGGR